MQIMGPTNPVSGARGALALGIDTESIITKCVSTKEARSLPSGSIIGDLHGGLTFTDAVAAALESRSLGGWQEIHTTAGETWTVIVIDR
jgi:hypothetical protein